MRLLHATHAALTLSLNFTTVLARTAAFCAAQPVYVLFPSLARRRVNALYHGRDEVAITDAPAVPFHGASRPLAMHPHRHRHAQAAPSGAHPLAASAVVAAAAAAIEPHTAAGLTAATSTSKPAGAETQTIAVSSEGDRQKRAQADFKRRLFSHRRTGSDYTPLPQLGAIAGAGPLSPASARGIMTAAPRGTESFLVQMTKATFALNEIRRCGGSSDACTYRCTLTHALWCRAPSPPPTCRRPRSTPQRVRTGVLCAVSAAVCRTALRTTTRLNCCHHSALRAARAPPRFAPAV